MIDNPHHKSHYQRACDIVKKRGLISMRSIMIIFDLPRWKALAILQKMQENDVVGPRDQNSVCKYLGGKK